MCFQMYIFTMHIRGTLYALLTRYIQCTLEVVKNAQNSSQISASPPVVRRHVEGLFPTGSSSAQFQNWKAKQTILKGGDKYQHPHCDNAIVNSYANLDVFPFVCLHGFGVDEFSLWLLPNPLQRHYGFEHKFGAEYVAHAR